MIDVVTDDGKHSKEAVCRIRPPHLCTADGIGKLRPSIGIVQSILSLVQSSKVRCTPDTGRANRSCEENGR